jgi:hypothetical protein
MTRKNAAGPWRRLATERTNPRSRRLDRLGIARTVALRERPPDGRASGSRRLAATCAKRSAGSLGPEPAPGDSDEDFQS